MQPCGGSGGGGGNGDDDEGIILELNQWQRRTFLFV